MYPVKFRWRAPPSVRGKARTIDVFLGCLGSSEHGSRIAIDNATYQALACGKAMPSSDSRSSPKTADSVRLGSVIKNTFGNGLYWFKVVQTHPDPEFELTIRTFVQEIAAELGIVVPPIAWYEKADRIVASQAFNDAHHAHPELSWSQDDDPTTLPCEYFRITQADGIEHSGYTPFRSGTILIATDQPEEHVLEAVQDECYHLKQDATHETGWRKANRELADAEADAYSNSRKAIILDLLARRARRS